MVIKHPDPVTIAPKITWRTWYYSCFSFSTGSYFKGRKGKEGLTNYRIIVGDLCNLLAAVEFCFRSGGDKTWLSELLVRIVSYRWFLSHSRTTHSTVSKCLYWLVIRFLCITDNWFHNNTRVPQTPHISHGNVQIYQDGRNWPFQYCCPHHTSNFFVD